MGIKDTVLGWLQRTPDADDEKLAEAEAGLAEDAYQSASDDARIGHRLGRTPNEFEGDQSGPR
ncbi:MAG: hypothetical protein ACRC50_10810 [Gaiella sp.]